jgi:hypothetical protein
MDMSFPDRFKLKSKDEIIARFREILHRHRRRFIKRNLRPCPLNCKFADLHNHRVLGCKACKSHNPEQCKKLELFTPLSTKQELYEQFSEELRDPDILLKEYRDIVVFLWILGAFDENIPDENVLTTMENHG